MKRKERSDELADEEDKSKAKRVKIADQVSRDRADIFVLPQELLEHVLLDIETIYLVDVSSVCGHWSRIILSTQYWKKYCIKRWGENIIASKFEANQSNVDVTQYFIPTLIREQKILVDWRRYFRIRYLYMELRTELAPEASYPQQDALDLKIPELQHYARVFAKCPIPDNLRAEAMLFLIEMLRIFYLEDPHLVKNMASSLERQSGPNNQLSSVADELLKFFDECYELPNFDSNEHIDKIFTALCREVKVARRCEQKLHSELVHRFVKFCERCYTNQEEVVPVGKYGSISFPYLMISAKSAQKIHVESALLEISKTIFAIYADESVIWKHKAACFKLIGIMEEEGTRTNDFDQKLFTLIKDGASKKGPIFYEAVFALPEMLRNTDLVFNDEDYCFIIQTLIDAMARFPPELTIGRISDALLDMLSTEKIHLITESQFQEINKLIVCGINGATALMQTIEVDHIQKIARLGVFGKKMIPALPELRIAFKAYSEFGETWIGIYELSRAGVCICTLISLLCEINEPETLSEARDILQGVLFGNNNPFNPGKILSNVGALAFKLFDSGDVICTQFIQALLDYSPKDGRKRAQLLGHRYVIPETIDSIAWNKKVESYLHYAPKFPYFKIPPRPNLEGVPKEPLLHSLNYDKGTLTTIIKVMQPMGKNFLPFAQEAFECVAFVLKRDGNLELLKGFIWLFNLIVEEAKDYKDFIVYIARVAFWTTHKLWRFEDFSATLTPLFKQIVDIMHDEPTLDSRFVTSMLQINREFMRNGINYFKEMIYKLIKNKPNEVQTVLASWVGDSIGAECNEKVPVVHAQVIALIGVTYGINFAKESILQSLTLADESANEDEKLAFVAEKCLQYISFDTCQSEENTYLKKFVILFSAYKINRALKQLHAFNVFDFDWELVKSALSSNEFDTGSEQLNEIVRNSDKSLHFWLSLQ